MAGAALALAIEVVDLVYGWPIIRTAAYRELVNKYAHATPIPTTPTGNGRSEWKVEHLLASGAKVAIQASDFMDVVKIQYGGEPGSHDLYRYVDYSSPSALRLNGDVLYVCWGETLIHSEWWLLAYDLANRREIDRRRVDPLDVGHAK